jgi:hypothetical protein
LCVRQPLNFFDDLRCVHASKFNRFPAGCKAGTRRGVNGNEPRIPRIFNAKARRRKEQSNLSFGF